MRKPLLSSSETSATSAVPAGSDKTAELKDITANAQLAKFLRPLQPQQRRAPPDSSAEDSLIRHTEGRLSQKEAAKSRARGSLKRPTVMAALANVTLRDRVREAAAEARAAHDSSSTASSSDFEQLLAHKSRLQVKPSGRRVTGKQQLSEAVKAHTEAKRARSHGSQGRRQAPKESRLAERTKKVKASAVAEAKKVVRQAKAEEAAAALRADLAARQPETASAKERAGAPAPEVQGALAPDTTTGETEAQAAALDTSAVAPEAVTHDDGDEIVWWAVVLACRVWRVWRVRKVWRERTM